MYMKKIILVIMFLGISVSFAQTKYLVYFTDKAVDDVSSLSKSSNLYQSALNKLTDRAIERRRKNLGDDFITVEDIPIKQQYLQQIRSLGIKIINELTWFNAVSAYLTDEELNSTKTFDFVEKIEPVKILKFQKDLPTETNFSPKASENSLILNYGPSFDQLQLEEIPIVHSKGINGEGVLIGMLDTGFDWKHHESLQNAKVISEYDFINRDSVTSDQENDQPGQHSHGTLTFSVVGGFKDSSLIGSAYGSSFILAKTEDIRSETHVEEDNYAAALEWMENFGVDISSSSLGYSQFDPSTFSYTYEDMDGKTTIVTRAAEIAFRKGVLTITSAGNEGNTSWFYIVAPADGINTIGVGAVDANNVVAAFSSRGPSFDGRIKPDVVTRGVSVFGAQAGNFSGYRTASGTSLSAPIASGIASLLLSAHPHLKNTQLRSILLETADNSTTPDFERGYGLLSALKAIEFPNLEQFQGTFILHKMFVANDNINPQSLKLHFSTNGVDFADVPMVFDGERSYTFNFPYLFDGDIVQFYLTYSDGTNNFREPLDDNYKFIYGQHLQLKEKFTNFIVSDVYPNPFNPSLHSFTRLTVKSRGQQLLQISIIDGSGQQVKFFKTTTVDGDNHFDWDGHSDRGILCASGVYVYLIRLDDKDYGKKMILIR